MDVLNLFETYTRAQFEAAGGPLIPFDPTRPEQDWWDDTYAAVAPTQSVSYNAVVSGAGGTAAIGSFTQTAAQMATPNFKGLPNYPKWTPAPSRAVYNHAAPSTTSPVDPKDLSTAAQAQALLAELGGTQHRGYRSKLSHAPQYRSDRVPGDLPSRRPSPVICRGAFERQVFRRGTGARREVCRGYGSAGVVGGRRYADQRLELAGDRRAGREREHRGGSSSALPSIAGE